MSDSISSSTDTGSEDAEYSFYICEYIEVRNWLSEFNFQDFFTRLMELNFGRHFNMSIIRSISMQWCTTARFQTVRACPFCGSGRDMMGHFIHCDRLWEQVAKYFTPFKPYF
eukprot:2021986-Karenia_brevis.AAC.1